MAQVLIRKLDEQVVDRLKKKADSAGRSLEAECRRILEENARIDPEMFWNLADDIREKLEKENRGSADSVEIIRQAREHRTK